MSQAAKTAKTETVIKDATGRTIRRYDLDLSNAKVMEFGWRYDPEVSSDPIPCEKGLVDTDAKIQSYARDADIKTILNRIAANGGDLSVAQIKPGVYGDSSLIPDAGLDYLNSGRDSSSQISRMAEALGLDPTVVAKLSAEQISVLFDDQIKKLAAAKAAEEASKTPAPEVKE